MKVLFVVDNIGKGGKERRMLELVKGLILEQSFEVTLVTLSDWIDYKYVYDLPIEFIVLKRNRKRDLTLFFKLFRIIKKANPDIIHSWGFMSNLISLPIAKILRKKFITSVIADAPNNLNFTNKDFLRAQLVFPFADLITSNSEAGLKAYKTPKSKSYCVYNGFDSSRLNELIERKYLKEKLGIEGGTIIGMVAAFEDRKDYETVIVTAIDILKEKRNIYFLFIGEGNLKSKMEGLIPLHLKQNIKFLGKIDNVESYINIMDIGILSTNTNIHQEGISNSILEYMALKKPVIATEGGGTNEIVFDKVNGFLVPSRSPEMLKCRILDLIENPEKGQLMGENGQALITETFSINKMNSTFIQLYKQLH